MGLGCPDLSIDQPNCFIASDGPIFGPLTRSGIALLDFLRIFPEPRL